MAGLAVVQLSLGICLYPVLLIDSKAMLQLKKASLRLV
jgi:hypothetical protein